MWLKRAPSSIIPITLVIASVLSSWYGHEGLDGVEKKREEICAINEIIQPCSSTSPSQIVLPGDLSQEKISNAEDKEWDRFLRASAYVALDGFDALAVQTTCGASASPDLDRQCKEIQRQEASSILLVRIGRSLAVLSVAIVVLILFWQKLAYQWKLFFVRRRQGHDLVIGLGWYGKELVKDCKDNIPTIAIDPDPDIIAKDLCKQNDIPIIVGSPLSAEVLRDWAGIDKVGRVFIAAGNDDRNLEIAYAVISARTVDGLILAINLDPKNTQFLYDMLQTFERRKVGEIHVFDSKSVTARLLFSNELPSKSSPYCIDRFEEVEGAKKAHIVIVGDAGMADAILRQSVQSCIFEKDVEVKFDVIRPDAKEYAEQWGQEFGCFALKEEANGDVYTPQKPIWLSEKVLPEISFNTLSIQNRGLLDWCETNMNPEAVTTFIVAMQDVKASSNVLRDVINILKYIYRKNAIRKKDQFEVWLYLNSMNEKLVEHMRDQYNQKQDNVDKDAASLNVRVFTDYISGFSRDLAVFKSIDVRAKRVNAAYFSISSQFSPDKQQKEIDNAWAKCTYLDRASSRMCAAHIDIKLRIENRLSCNKKIDPKIEQGKIEHRRWCAQYLMAGFAPLLSGSDDASVPPNLIYTKNSEADAENRYKRSLYDWFGEGKLKQIYKDLRMHADLMPYNHIPIIEGEKIGSGTHNKDNLVTNLKWIAETGNT